MNDAVVQLAKNFLIVMLTPVYRNIKFSDDENPAALPLMKYLQKELEENQHRKTELLEINDNLLLINDNADKEVTKITEEKQELLEEENTETGV
jgi:hypothetical protein